VNYNTIPLHPRIKPLLHDLVQVPIWFTIATGGGLRFCSTLKRLSHAVEEDMVCRFMSFNLVRNDVLVVHDMRSMLSHVWVGLAREKVGLGFALQSVFCLVN